MRAGIPAKAIILLPIGGVTLLDETQRPIEPGMLTWKRDIRIAVAGPLVNILIAVVAGAVLLAVAPQVHLWTKPYVYSGNLPRSLVWSNLGLALFNLLPAYPMDGGRVLRAVFSRRMDSVRATRRAVSIGRVFATLFMLVGMIEPAYVSLTMIGFFLFVAAQLEERSAVFQSVLETVRLEDIMLTDFATLSPADTLEDALEKAVHSLQDDFPVIRGSDMVGVISKQKILAALRAEGNGYVQAVMNRHFRSRAEEGIAGVGIPQVDRAQSQHYPRGRGRTPDWHRHPAKPDALHGIAGGEPQVAQGCTQLLKIATDFADSHGSGYIYLFFDP